MTFLVAEDNKRMREFIKAFLCTRIPDHHHILEATNGQEAIALYAAVHPDWVFMDIMMDPVDGLEASRAILARYPEARIIILTNYDDSGYRKAAGEAGTRAFVLKEHFDEILLILAKEQKPG